MYAQNHKINMAKTKELEIVRNNRLKCIGFKNGYIPWNKGLTKETDERVKNMGKSRKGITYNIGYRHSEEQKEKWKQTRKGKNMGKDNPNYGNHKLKGHKLTPEQCEKIRLYMLNGGAIKARKGNKGFLNNPERLLFNMIQENNLPFKYVGDGSYWFTNKKNHYNPDFISKNLKCIIELFGDYWHNLPGCIEKDKKRLETYSNYGYKTLVIWESELKDLQSILNKIKLFNRVEKWQ